MKMSDVRIAASPLYIESLDQQGRGIARREGKTIFVEGALPGESITASIFRKKASFEIGRIEKVLKVSSARVPPRCPSFGRCGGCALQHTDVRTQVAAKQRVLEDALWHIGKVRPDRMLAPVYGDPWEYRHRARFTVRDVPKKGGVLVGFHEKGSTYVADMTSCDIVPQRVSALLGPLRELVGSLSIRRRIPQIELSIGEGGDVFVMRVLEAPSAGDEALLKSFAERHELFLYVQPRGPDSAHPLYPSAGADLYYTLPEFDVRIDFEPTDFTQVNHAVNRILVRRSLSLLAARPGERVGDMFCGLGNFALPIARLGAEVVAVEGSKALAERARKNAERNGLLEHIRFESIDLFSIDQARLAALGTFDRMLIDPPRDGAMALIKAIEAGAPHTIVYVSCSPGTLARDAAVLVHAKGYTLKSAGIVNMFPHTAHVESVALFQR